MNLALGATRGYVSADLVEVSSVVNSPRPVKLAKVLDAEHVGLEILAERSRLCLLNELSELCLLQEVAYEIGDLLYRRQPKSIGIAELIIKPARRRLLLAHKSRFLPSVKSPRYNLRAAFPRNPASVF